MGLLQSSSLNNQNISSALLVGTYTPSIARTSILCQVLATQVAGNGLYTVYATRQINGTGAAYEYQGRLTVLVESGVTSIAFPSIIIPALANDVIKVYLMGLPSDTTTPDTICEFWDLGFLTPTTADRTLDVSATGEAGIDWANVGSPTTTVGLSGTTVGSVTAGVTVSDKTGYSLTAAYDAAKTAASQASVDALPTTAPDNAGIAAIKAKTDNLPTVGQIDTQLSATHGAGAWGAGTLGAGAISTTVTVTVSGLPRDGVEVWLTTDSAGLNVVASGISDAMGHITFMLDAGTYYAWKQLSGINFTNPETLVVS